MSIIVIQSIKKVRRSLLGHYRFFKLKLINKTFKVGKDFFCGSNCFISTKNYIKIGDYFYMGHNCHLSANANIGNDVLFASYVSLVGGDHKIDYIDCKIRESGRDTFKTITIEDDVWIGHGVIIMHGVTIHTGAVVASGAVVTKDVPALTIVGGNPAKEIRKRKTL